MATRFEFDPAKSAKNERERGLAFSAASRRFDAVRLEWHDRKPYGEIRVNTLGEIEGRIFFASFTRREEVIRIISFRKANARETRRYGEHVRARSEGDEN
jgi:uncharacterized protein